LLFYQSKLNEPDRSSSYSTYMRCGEFKLS
jgi:hypothetical protein